MYTQIVIRSGVRRPRPLVSRELVRSLPFAIAVLAACSDVPSAPQKVEALAVSVIDTDSPGTAAGPSPWTFQSIGVLPGTQYSRGWDISDNRTVVGASGTNSTDIAFYWTQATGMLPLPVSRGTTISVGNAISDNGKYIAGLMMGPGFSRPARWTLGRSGPVLQVLPTCSLSGGTAHGVTNAGVVVGAVGSIAVSWPNANSCPTALVVGGHTMTIAHGVNDIGTTVGYTLPNVRGFIHKAFWPTLMSPLPGDQGSSATDVNDSDLVVGDSWGAHGHTAVFWNPIVGATQAIGPMASGGWPALSDRGRVVWEAPAIYPNPPGRTQKGSTTHSLSSIPLGVNACGDIVGKKNNVAVLYKKKVCD